MVRSLGGILSALLGRGSKDHQELPKRESCLLCGGDLRGQESYGTYRVCPACGFHYTLSAQERVKLLMDPKGFKEKFRTVTSLDPLSFRGKVPYRKRLFGDQRRTGMNEAAVVGRGKINGQRCVFVCIDFAFMGGSMGCVVGEKVALAFDYAIKRRWPLVMVVTSSGVRIQEGVLSLMQMAKTTVAANQMHRAGLPYLCILASPTTGQAYASFVNLADVLIAEPGAIMGFSPLRVLQQMAKSPLPQEAHTSEAHLVHGMVDMVTPRADIRRSIVQLLSFLNPEHQPAKLKAPKGKAVLKRPRVERDAAEVFRLTQHPGRPTAHAYIARLFPDFLELHGDRLAGDEPSVLCGLTTLDRAPIMLIAQVPKVSPADTERSALLPEGFRKAQRTMKLAAKFRLPVVTLIDTPGPAMSLEAEQHGIGRAIADTMATMAELPVPTVSVIINQGGRESALAFSVADRTLMLENAVFLPVSPESAATLMFRDADRSEEAAQSLHFTANDCAEMGVIDGVVPEPEGGAHTDPDQAASMLHLALLRSLAELRKTSPGKLLKLREAKFRSVGEYTSYFRMVLARELEVMRRSAGGEEKRKKPRKAAKETPQKGKVLQLPVASGAPTPPQPVPTSQEPKEPTKGQQQ
ncbi:MAG: acetyl-CoA carboxylase carboxyl transferase subunit beta [Dehalococcoidia bacterium]|nr:acetyl-CoA carboxylase carboxyl transferase subunit beta [Dehalococcoidia bacterium]